MKFLNLDAQFEPFGKGIDIERFTFSGGEPHLLIREALNPEDEVMICCRARSFEDMGLILLAADALKRFGIERLQLFIPYFPAARQDRVMVPGEPLSVKVYASLVNSVGFNRVYLFDAHSEVAPALLNNCVVIPNYTLVRRALEAYESYMLVSPDGGALKKIYKLSEALGGRPVTECSKRRDVSTGKLSHFTVYAGDLQGQTCVVADDICDGGGTFIGLAEQLRAKNAGKLILVVSHGIFSRGTEALRMMYDEIYCSDSFLAGDLPGVTCIPFSSGLFRL